jgi:hypothetical protein
VGVVKGEEERKQIDILQDLMEREEFKARDSYEPVFNTFISNDKRMKEMSKENSNVKIDGGRNMIHISKTKRGTACQSFKYCRKYNAETNII